MAIEIPGQMITLPASTTILSTTSVNWQYRFVTASTDAQATKPSTGEDSVLGVLQNKPTVSGEAATIMINGVSKVQLAGSTVHEGQIIAASSNGMGKAVGTGMAVGRILHGSSGSTGRLVSVNIEPIGYLST